MAPRNNYANLPDWLQAQLYAIADYPQHGQLLIDVYLMGYRLILESFEPLLAVPVDQLDALRQVAQSGMPARLEVDAIFVDECRRFEVPPIRLNQKTGGFIEYGLPHSRQRGRKRQKKGHNAARDRVICKPGYC